LAAKKIGITWPARNTGRPCRSRGFSLLELVVGIAVLGVVLTIAVPSYQQYVQRAFRAEAIRMMLAIADCQERIRSGTGFYDTSRCVEAFDSQSHELGIEPPGSASTLEFVISAELRPGREDDCGNLSLDQAGTRGIGGDPDALGKCWSGR